ncbi:NO signaling/Golgi transport ligand-binding domain-containing protein [Sphaerosporella brunnea]|uniref:Trafficking protein particle complex subunit n=1 Tax=Sphaerosporella brunnea TaxID=1250544 RepID=A0A5J5F320_9PEZI|nr:NO signaling/Golgi transport ligand-binding domain-containing protein [Sphaerosporella brunnea]
MSNLNAPNSPFVPFSPNPSIQSGVPTATPPLSASKPAQLGSSNLRYASSRKSIYDRHLNRTQRSELSKASFAFLFGEMIQYAQKQVSGIQDLEKKLNIQGYAIGQRLLELLLYREGRSAKRETRVLGILQFIAQTLYRHLFGKPADGLEKSREHEDEYMLIDHDPVVNSHISVPKEMSQLNCAAFVAGIIEAVLDGSLFPCRVTAHSVFSEQFPSKTVFLIKFEESVLEREAVLQ